MLRFADILSSPRSLFRTVVMILTAIFALPTMTGFTALWATPAPGVLEVWVDDDYDPSTPGWGIDHFDKVWEGMAAVNAGGTVHVYAGIYFENEIIISKPGRIC